MLSRERGGASVNINRYEVIVGSPKTRSGVMFSTGEKAIADRAAFAMTFLQGAVRPDERRRVLKNRFCPPDHC
jgi:hypothetical protein